MTDEMIGRTVLGRYRIVARLAAGGMGVVYLARAEGAAGFAKPVVVKHVLPAFMADERMKRLFVREAKILANMQHANIVGVTDFDEEGGAYIMVLDYVRAYDLGRWLDYRQQRGEKLPVEGVVHIMVKMLDALEYAHGLTLPDGSPLEIVHGDISPNNVLVDTDGQVKLLDFGIARMKGENTKTTDTKSIRGKFSYLPVEALDGSPATMMTDVYACGVTLYELLAGENPFTGDDETRTLARVISHEPPALGSLRNDVSPELEAVVRRGMARDKTQRFATAQEFSRELRRQQRVPEDEAARSLAAIARVDFAAMPAPKGGSLAELEETWRNPPAVEPRHVVPTFGEAPTKLVPLAAEPPPPATATAVPSPPRRGSPLALVSLVVALAAVGLVVFLRRRPSSDATQVVMIERTTASTAPATAPGPAPAPAPEASTTTAMTTSAGPRPSAKPSGDPLSGAFAKRQPEIEACFRDQASSVAGSPEVSVRFSIDREGAVQRAELSPAELATTPLGACILQVARTTHFPAQAAPATFRIPLRARRAG